jgi:pyruvate,water dikinase
VFFLTQRELNGFPQSADDLRERIRARKARRVAWRKLDLPDVIDSANLCDLGRPQQLPSLGHLSGAAVAPGTAVGTACVVHQPDEAKALPEDCILVCPSTDPGWTPLFAYVQAVVLERGGILSHGAIVARDFGVPAVVCPHATRLIASGDRVRVDGNSGTVEILERIR